jgi:hypothetical protein
MAKGQPVSKAATPLSAIESQWQFRFSEVPGWSSTFKVPRFISRVDIAKEMTGGSNTHGWQVRYPHAPSRFFSDGRYSTAKRMGTPKDSLHAAKEYLASVWRGEVPRRFSAEPENKKLPTGLTGVTVIWKQRSGGRANRRMLRSEEGGASAVMDPKTSDRHCVVRVDGPQRRCIVQVYVGTQATFTEAKLLRAVQRARMLRLAHLHELGRLHLLPNEANDYVRTYLRRAEYWKAELVGALSEMART